MQEVNPQAGMVLLPPRPDVCQVCAVDHRPGDPHNAQSLYYQYQFYGRFGRWPTWADAVAHCMPTLQWLWRQGLEARGAWTEPPAGEEPKELAKPKRVK